MKFKTIVLLSSLCVGAVNANFPEAGAAKENQTPEVKTASVLKEWGGPYMKLSLGVGEPTISSTNIPNYALGDKLIPYFTASPRQFCWDFLMTPNVSIGFESGIGIAFVDSFQYAAEIVPTIAYINGNAKFYLGTGVGYAKGLHKMGVPNKYRELYKAGKIEPFQIMNTSGGYFIGEVGFDCLLGDSGSSPWFLGGKYQFMKSLTTFKEENYNVSIHQHSLLLSLGFKY